MRYTETFPLAVVINDHDPIGSTVVCARYCSKPLLPCGIPDLQLHNFSIDVNSLETEIDSYCSDVALGELIVSKPQKKARLSNARVTYEDQLDPRRVLKSIDIFIIDDLHSWNKWS